MKIYNKYWRNFKNYKYRNIKLINFFYVIISDVSLQQIYRHIIIDKNNATICVVWNTIKNTIQNNQVNSNKANLWLVKLISFPNYI